MKQPSSIQRPVGEGETNRSSDLEAVRNALAERGFCRRSIAGQWNAKFKQDLTAGIRLFQRQAGLAPDGLVIPGGPTALALALGVRAQPAPRRRANNAPKPASILKDKLRMCRVRYATHKEKKLFCKGSSTGLSRSAIA